MLGRVFMSFGGRLTSRSAAVTRFMAAVPASGCLQLPFSQGGVESRVDLLSRHWGVAGSSQRPCVSEAFRVACISFDRPGAPCPETPDANYTEPYHGTAPVDTNSALDC